MLYFYNEPLVMPKNLRA